MADDPGALHASSTADAATVLGADPDRGLALADTTARQRQVGPNELVAASPERWWKEAFEAMTEPLILVLVAVAVLYALLGELEAAVTIGAVILAVAGVEVINEARAKRAIRALRRLSAPTAIVVRDGAALDVAVAELVPGDLVVLQPGARVPADLRLIESAALRIDESILTGESAPVQKEAEVVLPAETELGDHRNLAFAGTIVVAGRGRGLVIATGAATELDRRSAS